MEARIRRVALRALRSASARSPSRSAVPQAGLDTVLDDGS